MNRILIISLIAFVAIMCLVGIAGNEPANAQGHSDSQGVLIAQAGPNLIVEDIVIRKTRDMNFRVRVKNVGTKPARGIKGKLQVSLSVKDKNSDNWIHLKTWENIDKIMQGQTVSRDYFATEAVDPNLREEIFTLKADISFKTPTGIMISKESITRSYPQDAIANP